MPGPGLRSIEETGTTQETMASEDYQQGSLKLTGAVAMGTGVMIGAGIFALTGQVARLSGPWFPLAFLAAALVSGLSAYSYAKVASAYPSAGGIAMILKKAYGHTAVTAGAALLMAFSMILNEALVARTFGTYVLQLVDADATWWVPGLAVGLIVAAFVVNIAGNTAIGTISKVAAVLKVGGILAFALLTLGAAGFGFEAASSAGSDGSLSGVGGFLAGTALAVLAYKGFTTITNSGGELVDPQRNVARAIGWSLGICLVVYLLVAYAVGSSLTVPQIVEAQDYALAEAARPVLGGLGVTVTVVIAVIATASGLLASFFAVSRMLAMLTEMRLVPHRHFHMPGRVQYHTLVYTAVLAALLAAFFDLSRIASIGAVFYLVMDIAIHAGVLRHLRRDVGARAPVVAAAMLVDTLVLAAFLWVRAREDLTVVVVSLVAVLAVFALSWLYLRTQDAEQPAGDDGAQDDHASGTEDRRPATH